MTFTCLNCEDDRWVCENHAHVPWMGGDGCPCGGAGMPCALCNAGSPPVMEPGTEIVCSLVGVLDS